MKQNPPYILVQLLFWCLTLLVAIIFIQIAGLPFMVDHLVMGPLMVAHFYIQSHLANKYLFQSFSRKGVLIMGSIGFLFGLLFLPFISTISPKLIHGGFWILLSVLIVLYLSLASVLFQGFKFALGQIKKQQTLEKEKIELELTLVRSQLNPHFLFNVLNNIDHYVRKDPQKASGSIIQLSSLLRYLLYETSKPKVPLAKEVTFLEEYIDLQKQRIQDGNVCTFKKTIADPDVMVVPAIFLPFLENAFSHCPLNQPGNFLYFEIVTGNETITFLSRNTRQQSVETQERSGLGLTLARKRLTLLYPDMHQLHIMETANHFSVELVLQTI